MRISLFFVSCALLLSVASAPSQSAPAHVATPDCPGAVRIQNDLPGPVDVEVVGASGPAIGRFRRVPGGQTAEVPIRANAEVSVTACGRLVPQNTTSAAIQGVRIENTQPSNADVTILGPNGHAIETVRMRGRESRSIPIAGGLNRVRISVTRATDGGRAAEIFAGAVLGGSRSSSSPSSQPSETNVHYHNGVVCTDPNCPQASSNSSSNTSGGNDAAAGIFGAVMEANRTAATSGDLVCGGAMSTSLDGVKIALQATTVVAAPGLAFAERTGLLHVGRGINLAGNALHVILLDVGNCGQALACRCGHAFCNCSRDGSCGGRERTLLWDREGNGRLVLVHACCGENGQYCDPPDGCNEGSWRWKSGGAEKDCSFEAPSQDRPTIHFVSQTGHGEYAVEGADQALGELANTLSALSTLKTLISVHGNASGTEGVGGEDAVSLWGGIVGDQLNVEIPTGPEELPSAYATNALRMGQKMADAAGRWSRANARGMVDLVAEVQIVRYSFKCKEIEICRNNHWVAGGWWTEGRAREEQLAPRRLEIPDIHIGQGASGMSELNRAMGRVETWLKQIHFHEMNAKRHRFQNSEDPCSACDNTQGGSTPGEGDRADEARRADCARLRRMLQDAEVELNSNRVSKTEYEQRLATAERGAQELAAACDADLQAARREMDSARDDWRRASRRVSDLLQIGERMASPVFRDAEAKEVAARARRDRATERLETRQRECDEGKRGFESEQGICRSNLATLNETIPSLERRVAELRRNLESCERGR